MYEDSTLFPPCLFYPVSYMMVMSVLILMIHPVGYGFKDILVKLFTGTTRTIIRLGTTTAVMCPETQYGEYFYVH